MITRPLQLPDHAVRRLSCLIAAGVTLLAAANAADDKPAAKAPYLPLSVSPGVELIKLPERAVKGGAMTTLKDGRLMLLYASKDVFEPVGTSALRAVYSSDGGRTWSGARETFRDARFNPGRPSLLRARNGKLWLVMYGFQRKQDDAGNGKSDLWITSSTDDGASWEPVRCLFEGYTAGQRGAIQTRDGRLVIVFSHAAGKELRNNSASLVSLDDGVTWSKSNAVELPGRGSHSGALEPTVAELADGRLWMLIRHGEFFHASQSTDGGLTWSAPAPTTITNPKPLAGAPASVIRLGDGRLAMAWNPRTEIAAEAKTWARQGRGTLAVAFSSDDAKTWSAPAPVATTTYLCYPHLLEYAPGQLLLSTGLLKAEGFETDVALFRFAASAFD